MIGSIKSKSHSVLKYIEKYTATDMVYLIKGGFWLSIGNVLGAASGFILSIAFANLIPKEAYGIFRYTLSIAAILTTTTLSGLNTSLIQSIASSTKNSFRDTTRLKISSGLIGSIIGLLISSYYFYTGNMTLAVACVLIACFNPIFDSLTLYDSILYGNMDFKTSTRYKIYSQLLCTLIMIYTMICTKNILVIILVYLLSWTCCRYFFTHRTLRKYPPDNIPNTAVIKYGKHLSAMNVLDVITTHLDKILIFNLLGPINLAVYSFALAVPDQIKNIFKNINALSLPKFSSRDQSQIIKNIGHKISMLELILIVVCVGYIFLAPWIFAILFPSYIKSLVYSQIYAVVLLLVPKIFYKTIFEAKKMHRELYTFRIVSSFFRIVCLIITIYFYGILGAITANIVSEIFVYIILWYLFKKWASKQPTPEFIR